MQKAKIRDQLMFMTILKFIPIGLTTDEGYEKRLAVATIREGETI